MSDGRRQGGRAGEPRVPCPSCQSKMTYGEPNPNGQWLPRLQLTEEQVKLLLMAASEFDAVADEFSDRATAVEFIDWISPDVLRTMPKKEWPVTDGAKPRSDGTTNSYRHRHPDPIPYVGTVLRWPRR